MDAKIKEDWVEALRSGEYVQGKLALDSCDRQCCLGVLCDILDLEWTSDKFHEKRRYTDGDHSSGAFLPEGVAKEIGILDWQQDILVSMNDGGATFDQIADYIEATL